MVQVGFAIMVSDEVHNAMRRMQLELVRACGGNPALRLMPHVTLKQPFHAKSLEAVESYFDQLAPTISLERIHFDRVGFFDEDPTECVAYLDPSPHPGLEQLRRRILGELAEQFRVVPRDIEDDRYHFHATLAYHLTTEQLAKARAALEGVRVDLTFIPDRLGLFYYTGDLWIVYRLLPLGRRGG